MNRDPRSEEHVSPLQLFHFIKHFRWIYKAHRAPNSTPSISTIIATLAFLIFFVSFYIYIARGGAARASLGFFRAGGGGFLVVEKRL